MSLGAGRLCQRATSHHTCPLYTRAGHLRATRREVAGPRPVLTEKCFDGTHAAFCQEKQGNCSSPEPLPVHPRSALTVPGTRPGLQVCHRSAAAVTGTRRLLEAEKNTIWSEGRVATQESVLSQSPAADKCPSLNPGGGFLHRCSRGKLGMFKSHPAVTVPWFKTRWDDGTTGTEPTIPCQPPPFLIEDQREEVTHFGSQSEEPHGRPALPPHPSSRLF